MPVGNPDARAVRNYRRLHASQFVGWNKTAYNLPDNSMTYRGGVIPARDLASILGDLPGAVAGRFACVMLQGDAVDTIAQTGGVGAVRKDMSKMSLAFGAAYLGPAHEERTILMLAHRPALGRSIEARPTGTGIVFGFRVEERSATADAAIHPVTLLLRIRMTERPLGSMLARYSKLFRSERLATLLIGFDGIAGFHGVCVQVFAHGRELFLFPCVGSFQI